MTPLRILLVDNDRLFLDSTAKLLRQYGFEVSIAPSFLEALDVLDRDVENLDVLVTNVVLEAGNGFALGRIARYRDSGLAAVYVTGGYELDIREANGPVLRKPVSIEKLIGAIDLANAGQA